MNTRTLIATIVAVVCAVGIWLLVSLRTDQRAAPSERVPESRAAVLLAEPIQPIAKLTSPDSAAKVQLGRRLFHEVKLSHDNTISCASCHSLSKGGTDQKAHSTGINGALGGVNAPTVLNSGLNYCQFWDGRARTLEDQVDGPTQHPKEMGSTWPEILGKLQAVPEYTTAFHALYPDGIQRANVKDAIAAFERALITPNAAFDRYLAGDQGAISDEAKQGYRRFKEYGCASCHQGVNVGGNMFQKFGVMEDYFKARGKITQDDYGRFNQTKAEQDRFFFRVPSLRNITQTAPYFHDGSTQSLGDAVQMMAQYQLGRSLEPADVKVLLAFLETLSGTYDMGDKP